MILQTRCALRSFLLALFCGSFCTQPASAVAVLYTVETTVGSFAGAPDPLGLEGASLSLIYEIDTSALTPLFDGPSVDADQVTVYPNDNTTASLVISGSSADGTYSVGPGGTMDLGQFLFFDNTIPEDTDRIIFPFANFDVNGTEVSAPGFNVDLDESFDDPSGAIQAYPFSQSDVLLITETSVIYTGTGFSAPTMGSTAGAVPEPSSALLLGFLALGLSKVDRNKRRSLLCHRKHVNTAKFRRR